MADLALTYTELLSETGYMLGYGETTGSYTADQLSRANYAVKMGLRLFYYPKRPAGVFFSNWTFMKAVANLSVVSGTGSYNLPAGFERFDGPITFASGSGYPPIDNIPEDAIREMIWPSTETGYPRYAAVRVKNTTLDSTTVQTLEAILWPTPNITATATYRYVIKPQVLESGAVYPLGSAAHASTIMAACKAAAELAENDVRGPCWEEFQDQLAASMRIDGEHQPEYLGKMTDTSYCQTAWEDD